MIFSSRLAAGALLVVAGLATVSTPASAEGVPLVLTPVAGLPTTARYNAVPQCAAAAGVATGLNEISFVVQGSAEAYASDGTVAIGTGITCAVVDAVTGKYYGSTSMAMPGSAAFTVGLVKVPFDSHPKLCGHANALFANNATAFGRTAGC